MRTEDLRRRARTVVAHFARYGGKAGARMVVGDSLDKVGLLRIAICYVLPDFVAALETTAPIAGLEVRRLGDSEIRERASRKEDWFFAGAVERSLASGDLCLGAYVGDKLVCSGWFGASPPRVLDRTLYLPKDAVFEYRLFTKPEYRGRRLNQALKLEAARLFAERGFTRFLNTVIWTNDASRRLHERLGYRKCGVILKIGGRDRLTWLVGSSIEGLRLAPRRQDHP